MVTYWYDSMQKNPAKTPQKIDLMVIMGTALDLMETIMVSTGMLWNPFIGMLK